jgi:hypothetical protein
MPEIGKVITSFTGFTGAPGYSSHYFFGDPYTTSTAQDNVDDVYAYWGLIAQWMPSSWRFAIQPEVQVLNETTGALIRVEATTPITATSWGTVAEYAGGAGAVSSWTTGAVHGSKQLRGRTFIVPLGSGTYDSSGTIAGATLTTLRTATTNLAAVANFGVWGRPVSGSGGDWAACTGGAVKDKVAWLSSRRD